MQDSISITDVSTSEPVAWHQLWIRALTQPSVATYEMIARDAHASMTRVVVWMFASAWLGYVASGVAGVAMAMAMMLGFMLGNDTATAGLGLGVILFGSLVSATLIASFSVLWYLAGTAVTHAIAKAFGGTGSYTQLAYAFATYSAPMAFVAGTMNAIPYLGMCLSLPLALYSFFLSTVAVRAVHQIEWGGAFTASLVRVMFTAIVFILVGLVVIFAVAVALSAYSASPLFPGIGD